MKRFFVMAMLLLPSTALAQPMTLKLTAGNMLARTYSHSMVFTITGTFKQLSGTLDYDLTAKTCHMDVTLVVESMELPNALVRSETMSQSFLDPQDYPTQHFVGDCQGDQLVGQLTMRGQTHPFNADLTYVTSNGVVTGIHTEGKLNRYDWGMNGNSMTVGKMIRVTNDVSLNGQPPAP
jgi:polyisoprenoid-binding protein YceI